MTKFKCKQCGEETIIWSTGAEICQKCRKANIAYESYKHLSEIPFSKINHAWGIYYNYNFYSSVYTIEEVAECLGVSPEELPKLCIHPVTESGIVPIPETPEDVYYAHIQEQCDDCPDPVFPDYLKDTYENYRKAFERFAEEEGPFLLDPDYKHKINWEK